MLLNKLIIFKHCLNEPIFAIKLRLDTCLSGLGWCTRAFSHYLLSAALAAGLPLSQLVRSGAVKLGTYTGDDSIITPPPKMQHSELHLRVCGIIFASQKVNFLALEKAGWELKGLHFCSRSSSAVLAAITSLSSLQQKHRGGKRCF